MGVSFPSFFPFFFFFSLFIKSCCLSFLSLFDYYGSWFNFTNGIWGILNDKKVETFFCFSSKTFPPLIYLTWCFGEEKGIKGVQNSER